MEIIYFIVFIAACVFFVMWATHRSGRKPEMDLATKRKLEAKKARAELLETPANYTLSRPDQSWHTKRHAPTTGVARTNAFALKSMATEPEYDGYSRRDRHHVKDVTAQVKKEGHVDEATARVYRGGHPAH